MTVYANPGQPRKVSFGWIDESFQIVKREWAIWSLAILIQLFAGVAIYGAVFGVFYATGHNPLPGSIFTAEAVSPFAIYTPTYFAFVGTVAIFGIPTGSFLYGGFYKMANKAVRGQPLDLADLFSGGSTVLTFSLFYLLMLVALYIAFPCGLIFGGYVVVGLMYPTYALLADGEGLSSAMNRSIQGMKRDWLSAAGLAFVFSILYTITSCFCVPIFFTIPMAYVIAALAYRDMIDVDRGVGQIYQSPAGVWPPPPDFGAGPPPSGDSDDEQGG